MAKIFFTWNQTCVSIVCLSLMLSARIIAEEPSTGTSDLWGDNSLSIPEQDFSGQELGTIEPGQLIAFERNIRNRMLDDTLKFATALKSCEVIAVAAYEVSNYVPLFDNENSEFWKETMIPILAQSLSQDVAARSVITQCFGRIGDLTVVIRNVYQIVKRSRGSKIAIAIAKKKVPAALDKLNDCVVRIEKLDVNATLSFAYNTNKILEIIGPEQAQFAKDIEAVEEKIREKRAQQQKLVSELGMKKGEYKSNFFLMEMTGKYFSQTELDLQDAKNRKTELEKLNSQVEIAIQNIPLTVTEFQTQVHRIGILWWRAWYTSSHRVQVNNPNKESQERFYDNVIKSRKARMEATEKEANATQIVIAELTKELDGYIKRDTQLKDELINLQTQFNDTFNDLEKNIKKAMVEKKKLEKQSFDISQKIGFRGNALIDLLTEVKSFGKSLNPGASAYSKFALVLNSIKTLVEAHIDLLSSGEPSDIFLAVTLLIEQAAFLSDYTVSAQQIMKTSDDYNKQATPSQQALLK